MDFNNYCNREQAEKLKLLGIEHMEQNRIYCYSAILSTTQKEYIFKSVTKKDENNLIELYSLESLKYYLPYGGGFRHTIYVGEHSYWWQEYEVKFKTEAEAIAHRIIDLIENNKSLKSS